MVRDGFLLVSCSTVIHLLLSIYIVLVLLHRFIRPEDVPVQYGGLSRPGDDLNGPPRPASEFTVKEGEKVNIQIEGVEVISYFSILSSSFD